MSLVVAPALDVEHVIQIQRDRVLKREYKTLGRVKVIVFEASRNVPTPPRAETDVWDVRMDWMGQGPFIALANDHAELLFPGPVHHPPDIPNPDWVPAFVDENCPKEKHIRQSYADRATGKLRGSNFLIFQPVAQILLQRSNGGAFCLIAADTNYANGTKMALLIDPTKNEGHLYGGTFDIRN